MEVSPLEVTIITGLSGAGKSEAVKSLEDLGFFCVDNLPPALLLKMAELSSRGEDRIENLAAVIDVRGGEFFEDLNQTLTELEHGGIPYRIIFLEADDGTLIRRFKETRRSHPIVSPGGINESIAKERRLLSGVRGRADMVIDTSRLNIHQLREHIMGQFAKETGAAGLEASLVSFGYKYGLPLDADMVFDLRFLPNPFWIEGLRELNGRAEEVRDFVLGHEESREFLDRVESLLQFQKDLYEREGRRYLTIAMGCTGGMHRSVVMAEELLRRLRDTGWSVSVRHRDAHRG